MNCSILFRCMYFSGLSDNEPMMLSGVNLLSILPNDNDIKTCTGIRLCIHTLIHVYSILYSYTCHSFVIMLLSTIV